MKAEFPEDMEHIWLLFHDLHEARQHNGYGPMQISLESIQAWSRLWGIPLSGYAMRAIKALDKIFLESTKKDSEKTIA